jgi:glycogen debranching enzyme
LLGEADLALDLDERAESLKTRFDRAFWCDDLGTYALALDHAKRPCRVRSSNAAQCLYSGIALPHRAAKIAECLGDEQLFSGWGVRTISTLESRYNPLSYHNGSIWPHDNALIAAGLSRYGHKTLASRILAGLFDASLFVELRRLPELFCGFPRRPGEGPTLYPVACSPQSWAAAAPLLALKAILGLTIDGTNARLVFEHPMLPEFLNQVRLANLRVGHHRVDLELHRHPEDVGIRVTRRTGPVEIVTVK